jgi:hypothetical protein
MKYPKILENFVDLLFFIVSLISRIMQSRSPFGETYEYSINATSEQVRLDNFVANARKNMVIQGLGFVGTAMAAAVANAKVLREARSAGFYVITFENNLMHFHDGDGFQAKAY